MWSSNIAFSIIDAKCIVPPPPSWNVIGRQIKMALFDKSNVKGNIHHIPAIIQPLITPAHGTFLPKQHTYFPSFKHVLGANPFLLTQLPKTNAYSERLHGSS